MAKSDKLLIVLPDGHREAFKAAADKAGMTLGRWMVENARQAIPKRTLAKLPEPRPWTKKNS